MRTTFAVFALRINPRNSCQFLERRPAVGYPAAESTSARKSQETANSPQMAIDSVIKRNDVAKKGIGLDRLNMALKDNVITPDVKEKGFVVIDPARFDKSVDQIALTYDFKNPKPKVADVFDSSFLPPASSLRM